MSPKIGLYNHVFVETNVFGMSKDSESDAKQLFRNATVEAYTSWEVPVPDKDTNVINS